MIKHTGQKEKQRHMENTNFLYKDCGGMSPNDKDYADAFKYVYTNVPFHYFKSLSSSSFLLQEIHPQHYNLPKELLCIFLFICFTDSTFLQTDIIEKSNHAVVLISIDSKERHMKKRAHETNRW